MWEGGREEGREGDDEVRWGEDGDRLGGGRGWWTMGNGWVDGGGRRGGVDYRGVKEEREGKEMERRRKSRNGGD